MGKSGKEKKVKEREREREKLRVEEVANERWLRLSTGSVDSAQASHLLSGEKRKDEDSLWKRSKR